MSATTPALIRGEMEQLAEALRRAGWDATALVVERGDGTILVNLSAWCSYHPAHGAFPTPALYSAQGEPLTIPAHPRAP